jgi:deoxycytidylate deaminase
MKTKRDTLIAFLLAQAELSKCQDKKTAAILVSKDLLQIHSIGLNGGPKGGMNCMCKLENAQGKQKYTCVHAEMNCLVKNMKMDKEPKILICTKQPCQMCASLIVNADIGIEEVWFIEPYWDNTGIQILKAAGIKIVYLVEMKGTSDETQIYQVQ